MSYTATHAVRLKDAKSLCEKVKLFVDDQTEILKYHNAGTHNLPRGKNLGSIFTDAQSAAIRGTTFKDIYVGDYWRFTKVPYTYYWPTEDTTAQEGKTYYADATGTELETQPETGADISEAGYFEKVYDTYTGMIRVMSCNYLRWYTTAMFEDVCHIAVVPDPPMFFAPMNSTNTTAGGYALSKMRTVYLKRAEAIFKACFGKSHVLKHKEYLVNAVTNGKPSAGAWYDSYCELMDERMVYGSLIYDSGSTDGTETISNRCSVEHQQLHFFRYFPHMIPTNNLNYWLRNVVSGGKFARVSNDGSCFFQAAQSSLVVRPYALIY